MNSKEIERIREINARKANGHSDSAAAHRSFLLNYIGVLQQQSSAGEHNLRIDCLAMFVRRMLRIMRMHGLGDREVCRQAVKYLNSIDATGSVLRNEDIQEAVKTSPKC